MGYTQRGEWLLLVLLLACNASSSSNSNNDHGREPSSVVPSSMRQHQYLRTHATHQNQIRQLFTKNELRQVVVKHLHAQWVWPTAVLQIVLSLLGTAILTTTILVAVVVTADSDSEIPANDDDPEKSIITGTDVVTGRHIVTGTKTTDSARDIKLFGSACGAGACSSSDQSSSRTIGQWWLRSSTTVVKVYRHVVDFLKQLRGVVASDEVMLQLVLHDSQHTYTVHRNNGMDSNNCTATSSSVRHCPTVYRDDGTELDNISQEVSMDRVGDTDGHAADASPSSSISDSSTHVHDHRPPRGSSKRSTVSGGTKVSSVVVPWQSSYAQYSQLVNESDEENDQHSNSHCYT
eukprot:Lankesteria_metandrocarpae@DN7181_c0_g1_i1.p1